MVHNDILLYQKTANSVNIVATSVTQMFFFGPGWSFTDPFMSSQIGVQTIVYLYKTYSKCRAGGRSQETRSMKGEREGRRERGRREGSGGKGEAFCFH